MVIVRDREGRGGRRGTTKKTSRLVRDSRKIRVERRGVGRSHDPGVRPCLADRRSGSAPARGRRSRRAGDRKVEARVFGIRHGRPLHRHVEVVDIGTDDELTL